MVPRGVRSTWQRQMVTDGESVGALLRAHRHAAKLTMEELAEASGVSARAISDMERGHSRRPQRRTLKAIIDALGLDPGDERTLLNAAAPPRVRPRARTSSGERCGAGAASSCSTARRMSFRSALCCPPGAPAWS